MESTPPGMRLASIVLNVFDLEQSTGFYQDVLGLRVRLTTSTAALLVGRDGSQLYLRSLSSRAPTPRRASACMPRSGLPPVRRSCCAASRSSRRGVRMSLPRRSRGSSGSRAATPTACR